VWASRRTSKFPNHHQLSILANLNSSDTKTTLPDGNAFNPAYLSKTGAFNGSGIAIASQSFGGGGYGIINVYFQHWTGQVCHAVILPDRSLMLIDTKNAIDAGWFVGGRRHLEYRRQRRSQLDSDLCSCLRNGQQSNSEYSRLPTMIQMLMSLV
jgi:hypothetical protein